jgi:plasmid stabilization system protein ParE
MDLAEVFNYIAADSPAAARTFREKLEAKVELLTTAPYLGEIARARGKIRRIRHGDYAIYYSVHRNALLVRAVVHGARRLQAWWLRRP